MFSWGCSKNKCSKYMDCECPEDATPSTSQTGCKTEEKEVKEDDTKAI